MPKDKTLSSEDRILWGKVARSTRAMPGNPTTDCYTSILNHNRLCVKLKQRPMRDFRDIARYNSLPHGRSARRICA